MQQEKSGRYELQIESASHVLLEMPAIMEGGEVYEKYENVVVCFCFFKCLSISIKSMFFFVVVCHVKKLYNELWMIDTTISSRFAMTMTTCEIGNMMIHVFPHLDFSEF